LFVFEEKISAQEMLKTYFPLKIPRNRTRKNKLKYRQESALL